MLIDLEVDRLRVGAEPGEDFQEATTPWTAAHVVDIVTRGRESRAIARRQDAVHRLADADSEPRGRRTLGTEEIVASDMNLALQHKDDAIVLPVVVMWEARALIQLDLSDFPELVAYQPITQWAGQRGYPLELIDNLRDVGLFVEVLR